MYFFECVHVLIVYIMAVNMYVLSLNKDSWTWTHQPV